MNRTTTETTTKLTVRNDGVVQGSCMGIRFRALVMDADYIAGIGRVKELMLFNDQIRAIYHRGSWVLAVPDDLQAVYDRVMAALAEVPLT